MIRVYRVEDLDELLAVWDRASRLAHPFLDEQFLQQERVNIAAVWLSQAETWVYVRDAKVVGFVSLLGKEVGGLFVDPDLHGLGIGRALMDHARTLRPSLEVEVFEANRIGRRFYEQYGFEMVHHLVNEETGQPVLRMRLGGGG